MTLLCFNLYLRQATFQYPNATHSHSHFLICCDKVQTVELILSIKSFLHSFNKVFWLREYLTVCVLISKNKSNSCFTFAFYNSKKLCIDSAWINTRSYNFHYRPFVEIIVYKLKFYKFLLINGLRINGIYHAHHTDRYS